MIIAGTVSAFLKLSTDDFQSGIATALALLDKLRQGGDNSALGFGAIERAALTAAAVLTGNLPAAAAIAISGCLELGSAMEGTSATVNAAAGEAAAGVGAASASISGALIAAGAAANSGMTATAQSVQLLAPAVAQAASLAGLIAAGIKTPITALKPQVNAAMVAAGAGMAAGLRSKEPDIIATAQSIASRVAATIRAALEIASPSKVMRRLGAFTAEGFAAGISDMAPEAERRAAAMAALVERSAGATIPPPALGTVAQTGFAGKIGAQTMPVAAAGDMTELSGRLDRLIEYLSETETVMKLDGRSFGRLVREYI